MDFAPAVPELSSFKILDLHFKRLSKALWVIWLFNLASELATVTSRKVNSCYSWWKGFDFQLLLWRYKIMKFLCFSNLRGIKYLPNTPCIYAIVQDDFLLYIGSSIDLKKRFRNHHVLRAYKKNLFNPLIFYIQISPDFLLPLALYQYQVFVRPMLFSIEKQLIIEYNPPLNKTLAVADGSICYWSDIDLQFVKNIEEALFKLGLIDDVKE